MNKAIVIVTVLIFCLGYLSVSRDPLRSYKSKRDFKSSSEPSCAPFLPRLQRIRKATADKPQGNSMPRKHTNQPIFVIQKHDASHLHYDFRLEIDGVLKSWAIPKGPSTNPAEKRLAMETEDHPMEYATFEGVIPEKHYGAGPVIVWDTGTFDAIKEKDGKIISLSQSYKNGQIEVHLHGKKLNGGYALIRTSMDGNKKQWLLIKMHDEYADARRNPVSSQPESVLSGKTIEEIADTSKK